MVQVGDVVTTGHLYEMIYGYWVAPFPMILRDFQVLSSTARLLKWDFLYTYAALDKLPLTQSIMCDSWAACFRHYYGYKRTSPGVAYNKQQVDIVCSLVTSVAAVLVWGVNVVCVCLVTKHCWCFGCCCEAIHHLLICWQDQSWLRTMTCIPVESFPYYHSHYFVCHMLPGAIVVCLSFFNIVWFWLY